MANKEVPALILGFDLDLWELDETDQLSFGRQADVCILHDPELDAQIGVLERRNNRWWLRNVGSTIVLTIEDAQSHTAAVASPGCTVEVPGDSFRITFEVGSEEYDVKGTCWPRTALDEPLASELTSV